MSKPRSTMKRASGWFSNKLQKQSSTENTSSSPSSKTENPSSSKAASEIPGSEQEQDDDDILQRDFGEFYGLRYMGAIHLMEVHNIQLLDSPILKKTVPEPPQMSHNPSRNRGRSIFKGDRSKQSTNNNMIKFPSFF